MDCLYRASRISFPDSNHPDHGAEKNEREEKDGGHKNKPQLRRTVCKEPATRDSGCTSTKILEEVHPSC